MKTHFIVVSSASTPDDVHLVWKPHQRNNRGMKPKTNQLEIIPALLDDHRRVDHGFKPNPVA